MKLVDKIVKKPIDELLPYFANPKIHPSSQIDKIASSIKHFGFTVPLVIDKGNEVIAGHGRLEAAKKLGLKEVPCIVRDDLTEAEIRAFRIADNRVAESEWDRELLGFELEGLESIDFGLELTGFEIEEIEDLMVVPDFQPVPEEDQPRLDEKKKVVCPSCGEEFAPS